MTNMQLMLSIGLPMLTILIGIFMSQKSLADLNARMDRFEDRFNRIEARLDRIDADLRQFSASQAGLKAAWTRSRSVDPLLMRRMH